MTLYQPAQKIEWVMSEFGSCKLAGGGFQMANRLL
jgi:hypothetical protein